VDAQVIVSVGQLVQEAIELMNQGLYDHAFVPTAKAISETVAKDSGDPVPPAASIEKFLRSNFHLITFMGMPRALPLALNIPFGLKRLVPQFNVHHGAQEIIALIVTETLKFGRLPAVFELGSSGAFEIKGGKLLLPSGIVCGLLGSVIFHPVNAGESIDDELWISISDFKMFVSELFGRKDLAERIMKFYLG